MLVNFLKIFTGTVCGSFPLFVASRTLLSGFFRLQRLPVPSAALASGSFLLFTASCTLPSGFFCLQWLPVPSAVLDPGFFPLFMASCTLLSGFFCLQWLSCTLGRPCLWVFSTLYGFLYPSTTTLPFASTDTVIAP